MHIWTLEKWKKHYPIENDTIRRGVYLKFDKGVDPEVKRACKEFCKWIRKEYSFPIRVMIYIKLEEKIRALDGELVSATFFMPDNREEEPYIRIAVGDYAELYDNCGKDNALATILGSIAHELTHYFQWINDIKLTNIGLERQAKKYVDYIVDEYSETREHP